MGPRDAVGKHARTARRRVRRRDLGETAPEARRENSPALQRWGKRTANQPRPGGTPEPIAQLYNFPFNVFTIARIAFSFRRYHRHCPFFVASTSPAFVRMPM